MDNHDRGADHGQLPVTQLEDVRIRLSQLVHSLVALNERVKAADLPAWPVLLQLFNVVFLQLGSLAASLSSFEPELETTVAYPLPNFPLKTRGWLLTTLLRKKTSPEVDGWIEEGTESSKGMSNTVDDNFCDWALEVTRSKLSGRVKRQTFPPPAAVSDDSITRVISFLSGRD